MQKQIITLQKLNIPISIDISTKGISLYALGKIR